MFPLFAFAPPTEREEWKKIGTSANEFFGILLLFSLCFRFHQCMMTICCAIQLMKSFEKFGMKQQTHGQKK